MTTIHISTHIREDGERSWTVIVDGCAAMAATLDEQRAREYARCLFGKNSGPVELRQWDGDAGTDNLLDRAPAGWNHASARMSE